LKVLDEVPIKELVTKGAVSAGVTKIPDNTICLFELKGQEKVDDNLDASIMLVPVGAKILHRGVPPSLEVSGVTNYGRLIINCE
jgi:hypothetical protein